MRPRRDDKLFFVKNYGQMKPGPLGLWKQPTDSGSSLRGSHSTISGKKMQNAIAAKLVRLAVPLSNDEANWVDPARAERHVERNGLLLLSLET